MGWRPGCGESPRKILAIQLRRIGDVVLVTPALDAMLQAWPEAEIHLLTSGAIPDLFTGDARLTRVWSEPKGRPASWMALGIRRERFDLVIDFQSIPLTAGIAALSGAYTVGIRRRYRSFCYDTPVSLAHRACTDYSAEKKLDLLRAIGLAPHLGAPRLARPGKRATLWEDLPPGPRVALVPTNERAHKRWPASLYAKAATLLHRETGAVFSAVGGPGEEGMLEEIAPAMGEVPHRLRTFDRLDDYAALLAGADLYLGNNTGPRHMATALGLPTLGYFSTSNPSEWTLPASGRHVVWVRDRVPALPARDDLRTIPAHPQAVAAAAAELLRPALSQRRAS